MIVLGLFVGYTVLAHTIYAASLAPTDNAAVLDEIKPLIHSGAAHQFITGSVTLKQNLGNMFDAVSADGRPSVFEKPAALGVNSGKNPGGAIKNGNSSIPTFFASLGNSWIGGRLFVGIPRSEFNWQSGNPFGIKHSNIPNTIGYNWFNDFNLIGGTATLQKVNVQGNTLASNLSHNTSDSDQVCVNSKGSLVLCGTFSCTGTVPEHSSMCSGDNTNLSANTSNTLVASCTTETKCEFRCLAGFHKDGNSCVADAAATYACQGSWTTTGSGSCSGGTYTVTTNGSCVGNGIYSQQEDFEMDNGTSGVVTECSDETSQVDCSSFNSSIHPSGTANDGYDSWSGSCTWQETKVDWNGNTFDWYDGYDSDSLGYTAPSGSLVGTCLDGYSVNLSQSSVFWLVTHYEYHDFTNAPHECVPTTTTISNIHLYASETNSYQCSNISTSSSCTSNGCTWNAGSSSTIQCSTSNPSDQTSCESQGNGVDDCSWVQQ